MLWLCFKLPSCLLGNTRDTSVVHEKAKSEIQICSNKHETGLVFPSAMAFKIDSE